MDLNFLTAFAQRPQLDRLIFTHWNDESGLYEESNTTNIIRVAQIIAKQFRTPQFIYFPELDGLIFPRSEQVRIEVFSTEYNVSVSFKESVHLLSVIINEFGCCAVGDQ